MLRECTSVRQHAGEGYRRWFRDDRFDLIVWYEGGDVAGFQLCYDTNGNERALTWYATGSYTHMKVDDGETPIGRKRSPVLVSDGSFDASRVLRDFEVAASEIDPDVAQLVRDRLAAYPE